MIKKLLYYIIQLTSHERKIQIKPRYVLKENAFFITNLALEQALEKMHHFGVCL